MNKQLLLSVSCASDIDDAPGLFAISIDDALAAKIKLYADMVKHLGAHSIDGFCYDGHWGDCYLDGDPSGFSRDLKEEAAEIEAENVSVDIPMLQVTDDSFYFTALPRYAGSDCALSTMEVSLSELDNDKPLVVLADFASTSPAPASM